MNSSTLLLHALKGTCALNCLAALHLAGPQPVTQRTVMGLTGFNNDAVRRGLDTLLVLGLVTCTGDEHRTAWQLVPEQRQLRLALDPLLPTHENRESEALKEEEKIDSDSVLNLDLDSDLASDFEEVFEGAPENETAEALKWAAEPAAAAAEDTPADAPNSLPTNRAARPSEPEPPARRPARADQLARAQLYAAFEAANIYLQFRRPLANDLLSEDGPGWVRQTLGWLCYAQRQLAHVKRGAVVYISLRDRLPCDPAYLPPPALPFTQALAWAARGGEAEPPADTDDTDDDDDDDDGYDSNDGDDGRDAPTRAAGRAPAPPALESPEAQLWRAVVAQLALELPRTVIDAQLRPARLVGLGPERCTIVVPTPQSRDWMALRLKPVLARALRELTGRALTVEIEADG